MRVFCRIFSLFLLTILVAAPFASAQLEEKVWRVIYVEGGPFSNYQQTLAHTARGLEKLGLISNGQVPIPANSESAAEMWDWLSKNATGSIQFLPDGHYTADWDAQKRAAIKEAVIKRIHERGDVDMIIAMGTWSGLDMTSEDLGVPVFSMSVTDAVNAGIVKSVEDSGKDFVHAQLEPGRFHRQIAMFHEIFKFKKLGVPFEDTPEGRTSIAMDEIEATAAELGIELVLASAPLDIADTDEAFRNLQGCISRILPMADAFYLPVNSIPLERTPELMRTVNQAGIPSFAQGGPSLVQYGVLMSLAQASFADIGQFEADSIAAVVNGKKPREVNQIFEPELGLAVNLKVAMSIGWNPPIEILAAVDEIFQQIPTEK